jgi:hypothetical protein
MNNRVIIAGGREFADYDHLKDTVQHLLQNLEGSIQIVSGLARGADELAVKFSHEFGYALKGFPADWDWNGKSAGYIRNKTMAEYSTHLIAFWDGKSRGTKHMIDLAKGLGLKVRVVSY